MAPESRRAETPLIASLLEAGDEFSFFQAVSLLEHLCSDAAPVGGLGPVEEEAIRFRANATLGFPPSDVAEVERLVDDESSRFRLTANFLGLYGPASPLPPSYTEEILADDPDESLLRHFLDVFHHRALGLFYRCWSKYRYYLHYREGGSDPFSKRLFSLVGLLFPELRRDGFMEWGKLLPYAGLLGMRARSGATVAGILRHYFDGIPVRVEECVLQEVAVEPAQQNRLGVANCTLGEDAVVGERVADLGGKFRLRIGPLAADQFRRFLPGAEHHRSLQKLMGFVLTDRLAFDVALEVPGDGVPRLQLGEQCREGLGWTNGRCAAG